MRPVLAAGLLLVALASPPAVAEERFAVAGQLTAAGFYLPPFHSPYADPALSFGPGPAAGWSFITTLYAGVRPWAGASLVVHPEFADGTGLPNVAGVSGYPDANLIRVAKVGVEPYLARAYVQQVVALGGGGDGGADEAGEPDDGPEARLMPAGDAGIAGPKPASRLEVTAGKVAMTDFFDAAGASSDPRHHFMNWSLMTNGAWDFAADTRGYTWAIVAALEQPRWAARAAVALMPTTANGAIYDGDLASAREEVLEVEWRFRAAGAPGAVKLLGYVNHARMGRYDDALARAAPGAPPSLAPVARKGATKTGLALLWDQRLGAAETFLRASWNDGTTETFAFTEIDRAVSAGAELPAAALGRPQDRIALGLAVNAVSAPHARYLAAGGRGFQLGDGRLSSGWETVVEASYGLRLARGVELALDLQAIANPGMNADRGPLALAGLRLHAHR